MQKLDVIHEKNLDEFNQILLEYASSDLPIENLNAVLFGTKFGVKDDRFIGALKDMLKSDATFFGNPLRVFVQAALDVLGVEKYTGDESLAFRLIETKFDI